MQRQNNETRTAKEHNAKLASWLAGASTVSLLRFVAVALLASSHWALVAVVTVRE